MPTPSAIVGRATIEKHYATNELVDPFRASESNQIEEFGVPRKQSTTLTEAELRIMNTLWQKGPGTVQQVLDWLPDHRPHSGAQGLCGTYKGWPRPRVRASG
jgi:hypothetical protein